MRIYMDVCCLGRPFDDPPSDKIYLETGAILSIISRCVKNEWVLLSSGTIDYEISRISNIETLSKVQAIYSVSRERANITKKGEERALFFQQNGVSTFDSMHVATAESCNADVFLTTDSDLLKALKRIDLNIKFANPVIWLMEVKHNER